jgi:hypothetical protein
VSCWNGALKDKSRIFCWRHYRCWVRRCLKPFVNIVESIIFIVLICLHLNRLSFNCCGVHAWFGTLFYIYPILRDSFPRLALTNISGYYDFTAVVDIYNGRSNSWSTASLSEARGCPAATSLEEQSMALFAGGTRRLLKDSGEFKGARLKGIVCVI